MESELVSGFMTEHSAVIFVFFFLAEYASIVLICILTSVLFIGGYLNFLPIFSLISITNFIFDNLLGFNSIPQDYNSMFSSFFLIGCSSLALAFKTSTLIFIFIWVRASYPRIRFDQLMAVCWTILLPLAYQGYYTIYTNRLIKYFKSLYLFTLYKYYIREINFFNKNKISNYKPTNLE